MRNPQGARPAARCDRKPFVNPEGIASFSPGLGRYREGLPWVVAFNPHHPERVEFRSLTKQIQPFQGCDFSLFSPRVARSSQHWAESSNPVGIEKPMVLPPDIFRCAAENAGEMEMFKRLDFFLAYWKGKWWNRSNSGKRCTKRLILIVNLDAKAQRMGFVNPRAGRMRKSPSFWRVFVEFWRDGCETKKERTV